MSFVFGDGMPVVCVVLFCHVLCFHGLWFVCVCWGCIAYSHDMLLLCASGVWVLWCVVGVCFMFVGCAYEICLWVCFMVVCVLVLWEWPHLCVNSHCGFVIS